ncbi:MAG: imidazolonepropionase, partial [Blastocatellia bacterium]
MTNDLVITGASQLLTLTGPARPRTGSEMRELGIVENGAALIRDGVIAAVGTVEEILLKSRPGAHHLDASGCVVAPGFVDAHTHPVFAGTREDEYEMRAAGATYQQIAAAG